MHVYVVNKDTITHHRDNAVLCLQEITAGSTNVDRGLVPRLSHASSSLRASGRRSYSIVARPCWPRAQSISHHHVGRPTYRVSFPAASDWERDFNFDYEWGARGESGRRRMLSLASATQYNYSGEVFRLSM